MPGLMSILMINRETKNILITKHRCLSWSRQEKSMQTKIKCNNIDNKLALLLKMTEYYKEYSSYMEL